MMQKVSSMVSANLGDTLSNIKNWGNLFYNAGNYGVVPGGKDVTSKLQALVNLANSEGRTTIVFPAGDYKVTSIVNDGNIIYFGDGAHFVGGYNKTINSFVDFLSINEQLADSVTIGNYITGTEYLWYVGELIRLKQNIKGLCGGDSTIRGYGITDTNYLIHNLVKHIFAKHGVKNVTTINAGHDGARTTEWRDTYLAQDLAQNPSLYIWGYGANDGSLPKATRLAIFTNALRQGLTTLRATKTVQQMTVILMMPNSMNDTVNGRDKEWFESIYPVIKKAARDFQCCFVDQYHYLLDSTSVVWQDDPAGNGAHIHPLELGNAWRASVLEDVLVPKTLRKTGYNNPQSNVSFKLASDAPSTYEDGLTITRTAAGTGFPLDGFAKTIKSADGILEQTNISLYAQAIPRYAFRHGNVNVGIPGSIGNDAWTSWSYAYMDKPWVNLPLSSGWVNTAGVTPIAQYRLDTAGNVHVKANIKDGTITAGTTIATLPVGFRPTQDFNQVVSSNGNYGLVQIRSSGLIIALSIPSATWVDFGRVVFQAEQ